MKFNVKILSAVLAVVVIVLAIWLIARKPAPNSATSNSSQITVDDGSGLATRGQPPAAQPPESIPLEAGARMLQNTSVAIPQTGQTQSTWQFVTTKTLQENLDLYTQFLQGNGWTIVTTVNTDSLKSIYATKSQEKLDITMSTNSASKQNTVSLALTQPTKPSQ